jgi:hypothetical protein
MMRNAEPAERMRLPGAIFVLLKSFFLVWANRGELALEFIPLPAK